MTNHEAATQGEQRTPDLSELACRDLLATHVRGRVGFTIAALPVIMPVEYSYDDGVITFAIDEDPKLRKAAHGHVLAFEVDAYDVRSGTGWSVHVLGRGTVTVSERSPTLVVRLRGEIVDGRVLADTRSN